MPSKKSQVLMHWFNHWFNQDYLKLYANRDPKEAILHIDFLMKAFELDGSERILDLGCGRGRHTIELAKRGFDVVGVDLSSHLIERGQEELSKYPDLNAQLLVADMYQLEGLPMFDVIINMFTSFGYLDDDQENAKFFGVVEKHLKPGGKFFLDYLNPAQVLRNFREFEEKDLEGERVEITKEIEGDRVVKTIRFLNPERIYYEKVKLYTREQIEQMVQAYGLTVKQVWGDYSGVAWSQEGERQLFYVVYRSEFKIWPVGGAKAPAVERS